ncbi:MAG: hypothetical protein ACTSWX_02390 [Promethearchaeota archaeon]
MSVTDILYVTVFIIRLFIAVALGRYAIKTKGKNFWWLFGLYFTSASFGLADHILKIGKIFPLSSGFRFVCMVLFIHYTFYLDRKNPTIYFILISVITGITIIIFNILYNFINPIEIYDNIVRITQMMGNFFIFSWLIYTSFQSFLLIRNDDTIDDWVKMRYKLVLLYSFIGIFVAFAYATLKSTEINFYIIFIFITSIFYQFIQLIAWVMPKFLRKYFNRHYIHDENSSKMNDELSEEDIIREMGGK